MHIGSNDVFKVWLLTLMWSMSSSMHSKGTVQDIDSREWRLAFVSKSTLVCRTCSSRCSKLHVVQQKSTADQVTWFSICRYTFYYYFCRSDMSGFMQVRFYEKSFSYSLKMRVSHKKSALLKEDSTVIRSKMYALLFMPHLTAVCTSGKTSGEYRLELYRNSAF